MDCRHSWETRAYKEIITMVDPQKLSNVTKLDDDSKMLFGTHIGKRLGDVPDHWFRWFLAQKWCDKYPDLVQYANHVLND